MKYIFDKTVMGGLTLKNRIVRSATGENLADAGGHPDEDLYNVYHELAEGGTALVICSFTSVAPVDHFNEGLLRLHDDGLIKEYAKIADMMHENGVCVMPQLALGVFKRLESNGQYRHIEVDYMSDEDVEEVIRKFVSAARRAKKAGFDGVQLHGCHGFVLNTFLSGRTNHRKDIYGGSVRNRTKVLVEIISKIKEENEDFHVSIKMNGGDLPTQEFLQVCRILVESGLDSIEYEGYLSDLTLALKETVSVPIIVTGGLRDIEELNVMLNKYGVEYFGMSRPLIREANLPNRWQHGDTRPAECISCGQCMTTYGYRCALKPEKDRINHYE